MEINANENFTGRVAVQILNSNPYYVDVVDGYGKLNVGDLPPRTYPAKAMFAGDDDFKPAENTTNFSVYEISPELNVHIDDICVNESPTIDIDTGISDPIYVTILIFSKSAFITEKDR